MSDARSTKPSHDDTPLLEWILGCIGAVLVALALGYLVYTGAQKADIVGGVTVSAEGIAAVEGGYLVQFTARNSGTRPLAEILLRARVMRGEEELDSAEVVLDYLPGRSTRRGGFFLQEDPRQHELRLSAEGFREP